MKDIRDRKSISIQKSFYEDYNNFFPEKSEKSWLECPFADFREIYILSACIGASKGAFKEIDSKKIKIFDSNVFNEHFDLPILYTIAYCKEMDPELLSDETYVLNIVEGFANGGFPHLMDELKNRQSSNLLNLANYIHELINQ